MDSSETPKMRNPLYITMGVVFLIQLVMPLFFGVSTVNDYIESLAISAAIFAFIVLLLGIVLAIPKSSRRIGQGLLLSSAILLLASFTLCSSGFLRLGSMH